MGIRSHNLVLVLFLFLITLGIFFGANSDSFAQSRTEEELQRQRQLQEELRREEARLRQEQEALRNQKEQSSSIERDIQVLESQIKEAELKISINQLRIEQLTGNINEKEDVISDLEAKIDQQKKSLANLLQRAQRIGDRTLFEVFLDNQNLSDFFQETDILIFLRSQLRDNLDQIAENQHETLQEKLALENNRNQQEDLLYQIDAERNVVVLNQGQKEVLLADSRDREKTHEQIVAERQATIAQIMSELIRFEGSGVDSRSISFGEAYGYAQAASLRTGVRPAFILAIMQQETGFGRNLGGCYVLADDGSGIYINSGAPSQRNMVPGNIENFKRITAGLGRDWRSTPISCAAIQPDGSLYGHGGAMGYTQFIPNTWMGVEARIRANLGVVAANPWNPEHAVWATAIFTQDLGAGAQTYTAEYSAACRYYGSCSVHDYGTSVMNKAQNIQLQINQLELLQSQ